MGKFVIKQVPTGIKFDLKANNGEVIGTSEVYSSLAACTNGIDSVKKNSVADIEDQTKEGFKSISNPKFELYIDKAGEFRFRLNAKNGEKILASEGYTSKAGCINGIESVKANAPDAEIIKE